MSLHDEYVGRVGPVGGGDWFGSDPPVKINIIRAFLRKTYRKMSSAHINVDDFNEFYTKPH